MRTELNLLKAILGVLKALLGALLIFLVHLPNMLYQLLLLSYAAVFNNPQNLTADPKEHLKRARKLLKKKHNSLLLYAAIELRFALERISKGDLFISSISNKARKQYEPGKHISALRKNEPDSSYEHKMILVNKSNGIEIDMGRYKPLNRDKVSSIVGKLGDILHPKEGLPLGLSTCPWYRETRAFLWDTHNYIEELLKDRRPYLGEQGLDDIWEFKRIQN